MTTIAILDNFALGRILSFCGPPQTCGFFWACVCRKWRAVTTELLGGRCPLRPSLAKLGEEVALLGWWATFYGRSLHIRGSAERDELCAGCSPSALANLFSRGFEGEVSASLCASGRATSERLSSDTGLSDPGTQSRRP